jgi:hypothetical protein
MFGLELSEKAAMPRANRFAFMRDTARSHPFLVASWAAMGGILLGGFVTLKMLQPEPRAEKIGPAQAAAEAKPAPRSVAETTGSAPGGENAATDCDHQTWPYLSRACMDAMQAKNHAPRVVSTDKLDKSAATATEASPASSPAAAPAPPTTPAPVKAEVASVPANPPPAAADSATASLSAKTQAEAKPTQAADLKEAKPDKQERVAKKAKRRPKAEPRPEPKAMPQNDSDDDDHVANAASDDGAMANDGQPSDDRVARGRIDRRRIVERRPGREVDVPADDGSGERRIVVIRRSGRGPFENLFGGFGN